MGKTTFYSQLAINCALHENLPAIMFSLKCRTSKYSNGW
jgi:replicative DNA helicase